MNECGCVHVSVDEPSTVLFQGVVKSKTPMKCGECGVVIKPGEPYLREVAKDFDSWKTKKWIVKRYKTCLDCKSVRDHFFCDGWMWETMWDDFDHFLSQTDGEVCQDFGKLTERGREMYFEALEERWKELDEQEAEDEAWGKSQNNSSVNTEDVK